MSLRIRKTRVAIAIESVIDMTLAVSRLFTFTTALIGYFNQGGIPAYIRGLVSLTELPYKSFRGRRLSNLQRLYCFGVLFWCPINHGSVNF